MDSISSCSASRKKALHDPREGAALYICLSLSHLQYLRTHLLDCGSLWEIIYCTLKFQFAQERQL